MGVPTSGKTGNIIQGGNQVAEAKNWKATPKGNNEAFGSNKVPGYKRRVFGNVDMEVSFQMLDNPEAYGLSIGSAVTLDLYTTTGNKWSSVPVMVDSYDLGVDMDNGNITAWDVKCSLNGQPTPWPPSSSI